VQDGAGLCHGPRTFAGVADRRLRRDGGLGADPCPITERASVPGAGTSSVPFSAAVSACTGAIQQLVPPGQLRDEQWRRLIGEPHSGGIHALMRVEL